MPVNTVINKKKNLVVHTFTLVMNSSVIVDTISKTLKNSEYQAGMNTVWYFKDVAEVNLSSEDLMFIAEFASKNINIEGKDYKLALVAEDDLPYGLTRVYEAWSSERPVTVNNFRRIDNAMEWVSS